MLVKCSKARQCRKATKDCYHKGTHESSGFCYTHICKFGDNYTTYKLGRLPGDSCFSCVEVVHI